MRHRNLQHWPPDRLVPYRRNPRTHSDDQVRQIAGSITEFGFTNPILVDTADGILAGHGRLAAAQLLGLETVPVIVLDGLSDAQRRAYVLADNKLAENAGWDHDLLIEEIRALEEAEYDLSLTGFSDAEISELLDAHDVGADDGKDPDAVPDPPAVPVSRLGDTWVLGRHRLVCGDATKAADVARLVGDARPAMVITDPPYNVDYEGRAGRIANDNMASSAFYVFLRDSLGPMFEALRDGGAIYVFHGENEGHTFRQAFLGAGFKLASCIIWAKNQLVVGRADYQWRHEPCLYGWKPTGPHRFYGGRKQTTIANYGGGSLFAQVGDDAWQVSVGEETLIIEGKDLRVRAVETTMVYEDKPQRSDLHPTMKPVALVERFVANSSRRGEAVLDLFAGSGSTLIACERLGRSALVMELDPRFVDVIIRRWQELTGNLARIEDGGDFFAVEAERTGGGVSRVPVPILRAGTPFMPRKRAVGG